MSVSRKNDNKVRSDNRVITISNALSIVRLLLTVPVVLLLSQPYSNRILILSLGLLAYATDLADGYMARIRKEESTLGRIIDPLADKILVGAVALGLLAAGLLPVWFVVVVVARDVLIFVSGVYLKMRTGILVQSNMAGKMAVVSIAVVLLLSLFRDTVRDAAFTGMMVISLGFMAASLYTYGQRFSFLLKHHTRTS